MMNIEPLHIFCHIFQFVVLKSKLSKGALIPAKALFLYLLAAPENLSWIHLGTTVTHDEMIGCDYSIALTPLSFKYIFRWVCLVVDQAAMKKGQLSYAHLSSENFLHTFSVAPLVSSIASFSHQKKNWKLARAGKFTFVLSIKKKTLKKNVWKLL